MYLVKYTKGSWDDYHEVDIFVTESKELAESYVKKFNTILERWRAIMIEANHRMEEEGFDNYDPSMYEKYPLCIRYHDVVDINRAKFEEIEQRYMNL